MRSDLPCSVATMRARPSLSPTLPPLRAPQSARSRSDVYAPRGSLSKSTRRISLSPAARGAPLGVAVRTVDAGEPPAGFDGAGMHPAHPKKAMTTSSEYEVIPRVDSSMVLDVIEERRGPGQWRVPVDGDLVGRPRFNIVDVAALGRATSQPDLLGVRVVDSRVRPSGDDARRYARQRRVF